MIDPKDIKTGAQFVVTVEENDIRQSYVSIGRGYGCERTWVPFSLLSPLPAPSPTATVDTVISDARGWGTGGDGFGDIPSTAANKPTTAAIDAEIVEVVDKWMAEYRTANVQPHDFYSLRFQSLINRRRAMLKQKDAVGELLEAVEATLSADGLNGLTHLPKLRLIAARVRKERDE